mmetsp:Transcript_4701/g.8165  ORF Transcript_4701/g.8165 Transcript_4701/m.8165 type:complete len:89 (-) Transcript_4701:367-633(-)
MCDELGDRDNMIDYVEEYGNTHLCSPDGTNCTDKEIAYWQKMLSVDADTVQSQKMRLDKMLTKDMKADLKEWVIRRRRILNKISGDEL